MASKPLTPVIPPIAPNCWDQAQLDDPFAEVLGRGIQQQPLPPLPPEPPPENQEEHCSSQEVVLPEVAPATAAGAVVDQPSDDDRPGCPKHRLGSSRWRRCLYGCSAPKQGCDKCQIEDLEASLQVADQRFVKLEQQILNLPGNEKQAEDAAGAVHGLYNVLQKVIYSLREASFTTFTNRRRLDDIRNDVKHARSYTEKIQSSLVSLCKANEHLNQEITNKSPLVQLLILHELYRLMGGDDWKRKDDWLKTDDVSSWFGLTIRHNQVIKLELNSNNVRGAIPRWIGALHSLEELELAKNDLSGIMPSAMGELTNLRILYMPASNLTGKIPDSFSKLTKLRVLYLSSNKLTGSLPESLSTLSKLEVLALSKNSLTGQIPECYTSLTSLRKVDLTGNHFTGKIPTGLLSLPMLEELRLSDEQIPEGEEAKLKGMSPAVIVKQVLSP